MRNLRFVSLTVVVAGFIATSGLARDVVSPAVLRAQTAAPATTPADFAAFLASVDAAQRDLQNGRPAAFKALWLQADDVTLSGGFGGTIEKGWRAVSSRLDWVGTQFSNGTNRIERIVSHASGDLGYVIQARACAVPGARADERINAGLSRDDDLPT